MFTITHPARFFRNLGSAALVLAAVVTGPSAMGLTLNGIGTVTDWGIKPFDATMQPTGITSVRQNNTSPINYGGSIGFRPSGGEPYDHEELHVRNFGSTFQVLLVTGSLWKAENKFFLGDLLMNTNGAPGFDMGLVTQNASQGLTAGQVYQNITTAGLQNVSNSYFGNAGIETQVNNTPGQLAAMFVKSGTPTGPVGSINTAKFNYGKVNQNGQNNNEKDTWLYEFTFQLPMNISTVDFQIGWGCGNDVIRVTHVVPPPPGGAVPEPASAFTGLLALSALGMRLTRRRCRE